MANLTAIASDRIFCELSVLADRKALENPPRFIPRERYSNLHNSHHKPLSIHSQNQNISPGFQIAQV